MNLRTEKQFAEWYLERGRDGGRREEVLPRRHDGLHREVLQGRTSVLLLFPTDCDGFGHFCVVANVFSLFLIVGGGEYGVAPLQGHEPDKQGMGFNAVLSGYTEFDPKIPYQLSWLIPCVLTGCALA